LGQRQYHIITLIFLILSMIGNTSFSQSRIEAGEDQVWINDSLPRALRINSRVIAAGDTVWLISGICKPLVRTPYTDKYKPVVTDPVIEKKQTSPLLKINGSVQYDFLYNSYVDTPFSQRNFQQHTVQASVRITVKDKYPLKLNIMTRAGNSAYFSNFFDAGLLLDQFSFTRDAKKKLADKIELQQFNQPDLRMLEDVLAQKKERFSDLKIRLSQPDIMQRLIEERESEYYRRKKQDTLSSSRSFMPELNIEELNQRLTHKQLKRPGATAPDTDINTGRSYADFIDKKRLELDSLQLEIALLQRKADSVRHVISKKTRSTKEKIYQARSGQELKRIGLDNGIEPGRQAGGEKFLSDMRTIGIGRSLVNYTELTAQGVSLTGINAEYNNGRVYAAVAGGKIDYGFRNFPGKHNRQNGQHLLMARMGIGDKDRRALIFSVFNGRKFNFGSAFSDSVSDKIAIVGYSLEAIWAKDENNGLSAEIAKSTKPFSGSLHDTNLKSLLDMSDNSNLGISIKARSLVKQTNTRLSGFFRKSGENFQSFSLFTYNTDQVAWHVKADQDLWKNRVNIVAMLRQNDFTNPFTDKTFKTTTVFTSVQTTVRIPGLPVLSAGYHPGSQLYIIDGERIRENAYYILNGSLVYSYLTNGTRLVSSAVYNRYSTKGTDTGFIAYKGVNYLVSQSAIWRKLQVQGNYAFTDQEQLKYSTVELNTEYSPFTFLRIGAGAKLNALTTGKKYWGSRAQLNIQVKALGSFQLIYDKSYLPTVLQDLFPIEMGRATWIKYF
jgi:hypothetical protein